MSPRNAESVAGKRLYADPATGEKFWSVTTIIGGGLPKPALLPWGIKSVAEAAVAKRKTLYAMTSECETDGKCAPNNWCSSCDAAVRWLKSAPYQQRDKAADLGTKIHEAAEAYKLGKPMPPWPEDIAPFMEQFEKFLHAYQPTFEQTELTVYNRTQRYAGTLDAILVLSDGRRLLVDYKSGKGIYPEVALQLAAYRFAEYMRLPDNSERPVPEVDGCAVLHLQPDRMPQPIEVQSDQEVFNAFLYCRETFRFMEELSKQVIGEALLPTNTMEPDEADAWVHYDGEPAFMPEEAA